MLIGKTLHKEDDSGVEYDDISLESLGGHMIFGEVTTESMKTAVNFILKGNLLYPSSEELTLFINTVGGSCYDGFSLVDVMNVSRLPVRTVGLGSIVSMGVLLVCAGAKGKRVMLRNTEVMAHQFSGGAEGKFHEMMASVKAHLRLEHQFIQHFKRHSDMSEQQIRDIMFAPSDRWLSPSECKKFGLIDIIVDELPDPSKYPSTLARAAAPAPRRSSVGSKRRRRK